MGKDNLNEREFELINIVGAELGANQRDISRMMRLSLGMVNMLIKRLISKGLIRIHQLDKRKVRYLLTPQGFAEKMRKSVKYTLKTINSLDLIKDKVKEVVVPYYQRGERKFIILGKSDFAHLTEIVFRDLGFNDYAISYIDELPKDETVDGLLLICKENINGDTGKSNPSINLIEALAEDNNFINQTYSGV